LNRIYVSCVIGDKRDILTLMQTLNYEQYSQIEHATPYILKLKSKQACYLYYFGEKHSFDPNNRQWIEVKQLWQQFLNSAHNRNKIVFTEGGVRKSEENEQTAILKHGGMGLVAFLAHQENIDVHSPEPDEVYERSELEKHFSKDEIQYYYFARVVHQWNRKKDPKPDFTEYIHRYLEQDKNTSGWPDYDFSLDHMIRLHNQFFNSDFDSSDKQFFYDVSNPIVITCEINKVSAMSGIIRDQYIVKQIKKYIDDEYSIFAQFGASHVVMQEPALRRFLTDF